MNSTMPEYNIILRDTIILTFFLKMFESGIISLSADDIYDFKKYVLEVKGDKFASAFIDPCNPIFNEGNKIREMVDLMSDNNKCIVGAEYGYRIFGDSKGKIENRLFDCRGKLVPMDIQIIDEASKTYIREDRHS